MILVLPASLDEDDRDLNPHCSIAHTLALASAYIGHKLGQALAVGGPVVTLRELQLLYTFDLSVQPGPAEYSLRGLDL